MRRRRRLDVDALIAEELEAGRPTGWFEPVYAAARGGLERIPWAADGPHPFLVDWLEAPVATPPGSRAAVVGCGLGDDAAELVRRGWTVTAFDVAPSAVRSARRRHRGTSVDWRVDDVLAPSEALISAFDLVVEIHTVTFLPGVVRDRAMDRIGRLTAEGGVLLVVTLLATVAEVARGWTGPPWPQAPSELATYRASGLSRLALDHPSP
ncbi:MAG: class I SAM-dependent methyltransferase, partial [Nitriliruptoraceae bacterium]